MTTDQGKIGGAVAVIVGALLAFVGVRQLNDSIPLAVVLILVGLALVWVGNLLRDVAQEVDYERDILE